MPTETNYGFVFSIWAVDPENESLLNIFLYVCGIINPLITDICCGFGYQGYLQSVKSLIIFFGEDEEPDKIEYLIRIFPLLHDAGLAVSTPFSPVSKKFLQAISELESYLDITPELCSQIFDF
jgi:hypothetical protein